MLFYRLKTRKRFAARSLSVINQIQSLIKCCDVLICASSWLAALRSDALFPLRMRMHLSLFCSVWPLCLLECIHRKTRLQTRCKVFITLCDGLGVNNMRCTNRRSSRTYTKKSSNNNKQQLTYNTFDGLAWRSWCCCCRLFHTNEKSRKNGFTTLVHRTKYSLFFVGTAKKGDRVSERARRKRTQADSVLFIVLFAFCSVSLGITLLLMMLCVFLSLDSFHSAAVVVVVFVVIVVWVCVVFRVFASKFDRNIFRLILSRTRAELWSHCIFCVFVLSKICILMRCDTNSLSYTNTQSPKYLEKLPMIWIPAFGYERKRSNRQNAWN